MRSSASVSSSTSKKATRPTSRSPKAAASWCSGGSLLTRVTADLPGSGGRLERTPDDFEVTEILPYPASGAGEHLFIFFEKRGLTTPDAVRSIAAKLDRVDPRGRPVPEVGFAGMKDKSAIAKQWMSLPWPIKAELPSLSLELEGVRLLSMERHLHKIRRGHQRGNRFRIVIRECPVGAIDRASAVLARLREIGVPNFFGPQRFGIEGDNAERARAFVSGKERAPRDRRLQDLLVSALQSEIFNRVLERRIETGSYARALLGDVMQKHETGGMFVTSEPEVDQRRVEALEISPCGPLPGKKTKATEADAAALEASVLTELAFTPGMLDRWADGTRRLMRYPLDPECRLVARDEKTFELEVTLPSGAYATVLLDEVIKPASGRFDREID